MDSYKDHKKFGPYQLHAKIAEGGMAEVLLGTSQQKEFQGQFLAIKRLRPHLNSNKPFVNLLIHEAKIGVLLNHPGIASVYDLGSYKSEFFLAMEYVHGKSLDKVLERIQAGKSPRLSVEVSTYIILEILRALAFAHALKDSKGRDLNIIHRDVSPGNILLSYRGEAKLTDFGIATAESRLQTSLTNTPLGKLAYISPEQLVNDPVVRASDIYSLGVVYYQLLSGQLPFHADSANNLFKKVVDGRITDLRLTGPTISPGLRDIVNACLNRSAQKRYASAPELFQVIVDHFNKEYELDFNSKAIRQYYKKKLSEYLRACFESEIVHEIEITQECLARVTKSEDFNVTAPQDLKRLSDFEKKGGPGEETEATVYQEDYSHEATRHFPLTEDERKRILQGLPAKEVMAETKKRAESKRGKSSGFDMETIPEYDLATEDSALQRLSVRDKLKLSSLAKDHQETLNQHLPHIEISSPNDLENFERNTFSEKQKAPDDSSTRAMSRDEVMRDFKKLREAADNAKVSVDDEATILDSESAVKSDRRKIEPTRISQSKIAIKTVERTSFVQKNKISRWAFWVSLWFSILFMAVGTGWWLFKVNTAPARYSSLGLTAPKNVGLIFVSDLDTEAQKQFIQTLNERGGFSSIENLFRSEHRRYTGSEEAILKVSPSQPSTLTIGIASQPNAADLIKSESVFDFLQKGADRGVLNSGPVIYIYLYAFDPSSNQNAIFPDHYLGGRNNTRGLVFAPAHSSKVTSTLLNIAREVAFLYGASDKQDAATGMPMAPDGLANPKEVPMYPQAHAELMGKDVALNVLQKRPVTDLSEVRIGAQTAYELGWIDRFKRNELMK